MGRGLSLRARLLTVLGTFTGLMMWTFTIDPTLFDTPAAAYEYVGSKRCISNVMRRLRKLGHLHSGRYICIVEWQRETQMAHFHLLADASYIPFETVCGLWNRYRPTWAGPVQGERPAFGAVRFSAPKFRDPKHAACYACKYLIKFPEHGYPDWVLDSEGEIHRYTSSRGFWGDAGEPGDAPDGRGADDTAEDREEGETADDDAGPAAEEDNGSTIRGRLAKCGLRSVVLRIAEGIDEGTGEVVTRREFVCCLEADIATVAAAVGRPLGEGRRRLTIDDDALPLLLQRYRIRDDFKRGPVDSTVI